MPLHLKQKIRKVLHPRENSRSGSSDREEQVIPAGSTRDPKARRTGDEATTTLASSNARGGDFLSDGLAQLDLKDKLPEQRNGRADGATPAEYGSATSSNPDGSTADEIEKPNGYARSVAISDDEDPYSERVADRNISPPGNWTYSEDKDVETTQLPAVTHETRVVNTHEIVEQRVTRDIHNYDVYHRVLPVIDVEVLPPRHFVPSGSGDSLVEIPASQVPFGGSDDAAIQRAIKKAYLKERLQPRSAGAT